MYVREHRVLLRHYLEQGLSKAEIARTLLRECQDWAGWQVTFPINIVALPHAIGARSRHSILPRSCSRLSIGVGSIA